MSSPALVKYINFLPQNISDNIILKVNPKNVHFLRKYFLVDSDIDKQYSKQWYSNIFNMIPNSLAPEEKELLKKWILSEKQDDSIYDELKLIISQDVNNFVTKLLVIISGLKYYDLFDRLFENWFLINQDLDKKFSDRFADKDNYIEILKNIFNNNDYELLERVFQILGEKLTADDHYNVSYNIYRNPNAEKIMKYLDLVKQFSSENNYKKLVKMIFKSVSSEIGTEEDYEHNDNDLNRINKLQNIYDSIENLPIMQK